MTSTVLFAHLSKQEHRARFINLEKKSVALYVRP